MRKKIEISVILTGGRSAERVYREWRKSKNLEKYEGIRFYFSDERLESPANEASNYDMVMQTLFSEGLPENCDVYPILRNEDSNLEAKRYSKLLPKKIEILILTLGDDGHIASIFPDSPVIFETDKLVAPVIHPEHGGRRISITPILMNRVVRTFVFAPGLRKLELLDRVFEAPHCPTKIPGQLITAATWFLCV